MSNKEFWEWLEDYMTRMGYGIGTQHEIDGLKCTVDSHATDGNYVCAVCSVNGQPHLPEKVIKLPWPGPV